MVWILRRIEAELSTANAWTADFPFDLRAHRYSGVGRLITMEK